MTMTIDETNGAAWPLNDIGALARHVPEVDPSQYFDEQARLAYEEARVKWPVLARLMGLVEAPQLSVDAAADARRTPLRSASTS